MITSFFTKAYGTAVILKHLIGQRRVPYLPEEKLREIRDRRLRQMVRYAADTVPYYRDFFRKEGIDPEEIRCPEDLDRLPLINKEVVRKQPERFISESRWGRTAVPFTTSGSTGSPLTIPHDRHSLLANVAIGERERAVIRKVLGGYFGHRWCTISPRETAWHIGAAFVRESSFIPVGRGRVALSFMDPIEHIVAAINEYRPDAISCFAGSYLEMLFKTVAARAIKIHIPRLVVYHGDAMTDGGKRLIEEDFGVPVLSRYNAGEAFKIGFTCEERTGFHLHDDLTCVKIVDRKGQRLPMGEKGEVVISNLFNRGMVLLNYRLGDVGSLSDERCPCGRNFRLLSNLEGCLADQVYLPHGGFLHYAAIWHVFNSRNEVLQYQLIQPAPQLFELRLATVDRVAFDRMVGDVIADLRPLLGQSAVIEPAYYERLEPYGRAKFRPVVSLVEAKQPEP